MEDIEDDNEDGFFVGHGVLDKDEARHEDDSDEEVTNLFRIVFRA